jgi:NitT/TauT family transport system permease protein
MSASARPVVLGALGVAGVLILWEALSALGAVNPFFVSAPSRVALALVQLTAGGELLANLMLTLGALLGGFGLAVLVGVPVGLAMGWWRPVEWVLGPYVWFLAAAPLIAFFPLFIMWLGFGMPTIVAIAFLMAVFPIVVNSMVSVRTVDPSLVRAARAFGAGTTTVALRVILPASLPLVVAGLRLGMGRALIGVVVGEFFSANAGMGFYVLYWGRQFRMADAFAYIVAIAVIALVTTQGLRWLEACLSRWRTV